MCVPSGEKERYNYLIDAVSALSFDSVVGLSPALELVEGSAGVERLAVEDIDASQIKGFCCFVCLGRDAALEPERFWSVGRYRGGVRAGLVRGLLG